jgi:hypothetical protein
MLKSARHYGGRFLWVMRPHPRHKFKLRAGEGIRLEMQAKKFAKRDTGRTFFGISSRFDWSHKSFKYVPRGGGAVTVCHSAERSDKESLTIAVFAERFSATLKMTILSNPAAIKCSTT